MAELGSRALFPHLRDRIYLGHAGVSPLSVPVQQAMAHYALRLAEEGFGSVPEVLAMRRRLRTSLGRLLGCPEEHLALTGGTSWGVLAVAQNLAWKAGQRVAVVAGDFPTNVTPWQRAAAQYQLELVSLSVDLKGLQSELERGLRLLALSAVQFQSGFRQPCNDIVQLCHAYDCEVFVDAIQACGVVPFQVGPIDYVAGGAHKWLMGVEGCGFLYVSPACQDRFRRNWAGWLSHEDPVSFLFEGSGHLRYDRPLRSDMQFLEIGSCAAVAQVALEASLTILHELQVDRIFDHVSTYLDRLEPLLIELGFTSLRDPLYRSGILALRPPFGAPDAWAQALLREGVRISTPDGLLRLAPHWPNSLDEVEDVVTAFRKVVSRGAQNLE
jgi:selenocysteine lyase/cysteine desulfurase